MGRLGAGRKNRAGPLYAARSAWRPNGSPGIRISLNLGSALKQHRATALSCRSHAQPARLPINKAGVVGSSRLTDQSVALTVKAYAERAGLDPRQFAGHSLRSGFLTSATGKGASIFKMMDGSRHNS